MERGPLQGRSEVCLGGFLATLPAPGLPPLRGHQLRRVPWRLGRKRLIARVCAMCASRGCRRLEKARPGGKLHWEQARYAPWQDVLALRGLVCVPIGGPLRRWPGLGGLLELGARAPGAMNPPSRLALPVHVARWPACRVQLSLLAPDALRPRGVARYLPATPDVELMPTAPGAREAAQAIPAASGPALGPVGPRGCFLPRLRRGSNRCWWRCEPSLRPRRRSDG